MNPHQDSQDSPSQPDATRPPQLNQTVSGYRCGNGIANSLDDGGGAEEDDAASTLIPSDGSERDEQLSDSSGETLHSASFDVYMPSPVSILQIDEFRARIGMFINGEGVQHVFEINDMLFHLSQMGLDQDVNSMINEPGSEGHSVVAPDAVSIRGISPGPGLGAWVEYYFVVRPLRLTPQ